MVSRRWLLAVVLAGGVGFLGLAPARADRPAAELFEVERHADIAYRTDPDADKVRHRLDVYVPKGRKDFPVLFFVHGGAWTSGSKDWYVSVGNAFAAAGIGTVVTNYRLSPQVKHPAHAEDVAKAFAWAAENVGKYGGRADRIFLFGHSAGGHLVSLLATDASYLKAVKHSPDEVRGVVAVSGVYRLHPEFPLFQSVFGKDEEVCKKASPLTHAGGKHPPFLIVYAESDYRELDRMAIDMHAALEKAKSPAALLKCAGRNHISIITRVIDADDPLNTAVRDFVAKNEK